MTDRAGSTADQASASRLPRDGGEPFWTRGWTWALIAVFATSPFWFAQIPPLTDFPGHVGQYHVMLDLGQSRYLGHFYGFKWSLVGNLGVDLLMLAVGPLLGVERGAWLIAALTPALMVAGIFAVSKAVHGRPQPTSLLALPFVYANAFEWGFLNYDLTVGLMLLAFALWVGWRERPKLRAPVFVALSFGLWVFHAAAWGAFCLFVGGFELQRAVEQRGWRWAAIGQTVLQVLPVAPPVLLALGMPQPTTTPYNVGGSLPGLPPGIVGYKLSILFNLLHDRSFPIDALSILVIAGLYIYARSKGAVIRTALALPAALTGLAVVLMPPIAAGSALADYRLAPVAVIAFLLALRFDSATGARLIASAALALTIVRVAVTAQGWHQDDQAFQRHLSALDRVPMGARILVLTTGSSASQWIYGSRPLGHLADLA